MRSIIGFLGVNRKQRRSYSNVVGKDKCDHIYYLDTGKYKVSQFKVTESKQVVR